MASKQTLGSAHGPAEPPTPRAPGSELDGLEAFTRINDRFWRSVLAVNQELVSFGQARAKANLERTASLMQCHDPEDALRVTMEFAQSAAQDYADETGRIMTLWTGLAAGCWDLSAGTPPEAEPGVEPLKPQGRR